MLLFNHIRHVLFDRIVYMKLETWPGYTPTIMEKINGQTPKKGVVFDTTSNVQPI